MNYSSVNVRYSLQLESPESHFLQAGIELDVPGIINNFIDLKLPVWRPGRYLILEFASSIQDFNAFDINNNPLNWQKTNKSTWRIYGDFPGIIRVSYKIYANEFNLRTKGLDENHAFINPASVFMYSDIFRDKALTLQVKQFKDWHVSTALQNIAGNTFYADNYDILADSPFEIGNQKDYEFYVEGKKHSIAFYGNARYDIERIINDFTKIIKANFEFWNSVPYEKYVFIVHCTPVSSGGTEHFNSTVVGIKPAAFETDEGYKSFLRLISHEFFHTWNVKQMKPAGLTPYDYEKENYTSELWIAEGGTSYYDSLILVRTGQLSITDFFKEIAYAIYDERKRPGYRVQSVSESSFDAWVKFWRFSPNAYFTESDYYTMGSYVCTALDLFIRQLSINSHSLDSVFRTIYERFPSGEKGYTNNDFRKVCEEFSGKSLTRFFDEYVYGTKPIEWQEFLSYAGLKLVEIEDNVQPVIGLFPGKTGDKIIVSSVLAGSPADKAGIIKGDEIVACDGVRLPFDEMEKKIKSLDVNGKIELTVFRGNKLKNFLLRFAWYILENYKLEKIDNPTDLQKSIFESWLNTNW